MKDTEPTEPAVESEQPETLDDVYKEFDVETQAEEFKAEPEPTPVTQEIPDPLDTDAYRNYERQNNDAIMKELDSVKAKLTEFQKGQQEAQISKDIQQAVEFIKPKVEGVKEKAIEIQLEMKAAEDPKFKRLWDNRNSNPTAWNRALSAFANEVAETHSIKQDPQLTENMRAVAQSQHSMTTNAPDPHDEWPDDPDEFDQKWGQLKNRG